MDTGRGKAPLANPEGEVGGPGGILLSGGGFAGVGPSGGLADGTHAAVAESFKPLPGPLHAGAPGPGSMLLLPPQAGAVFAGVGLPQADVPVAAGILVGPPPGRAEVELGVPGMGTFLEAGSQAELDWPGTDWEPKVNLLQPPTPRMSVRLVKGAPWREAVVPC